MVDLQKSNLSKFTMEMGNESPGSEHILGQTFLEYLLLIKTRIINNGAQDIDGSVVEVEEVTKKKRDSCLILKWLKVNQALLFAWINMRARFNLSS